MLRKKIKVWRSTNPVARAALAQVIFLLAGCAATPESATFVAPIYPPPPEPARFIFEQTLVNSVQITTNAKESRMLRMLAGEVSSGMGLSKPFDVTTCKGRVFVSDSVQRIVHVFDYPQKRYFRIGENEPGMLAKPLGLATDGNCNLYVVDASQYRVAIYNRDGEFLSAIGGAQWFARPSHVAVDAAGTRAFVVDTGNVQSLGHKIRIFDVQTGEHQYDIGERGDEEGELNLPRDISVGPDGKIYLVDGGNFRVQIFERDGTFVRSFGRAGARGGQFSRPKGVALDPQGNIYVSDAAFGNFQIFNPEGQLLLAVGARSGTPGPGKYQLPAGIHVDEDGRIYFVGQYFRKIDIFRPAQLDKEEGFLGAFYVD